METDGENQHIAAVLRYNVTSGMELRETALVDVPVGENLRDIHFAFAGKCLRGGHTAWLTGVRDYQTENSYQKGFIPVEHIARAEDCISLWLV